MNRLSRRTPLLTPLLLLPLLSACCAGFIPLPPLCADETVGEVVDAVTGEPIQNAQVTLSAVTSYLVGDPMPIHKMIRTRKDGSFRLGHPDIRDVSLFVVADGYHAVKVSRSTFTTRVELVRPVGDSPAEEAASQE